MTRAGLGLLGAWLAISSGCGGSAENSADGTDSGTHAAGSGGTVSASGGGSGVTGGAINGSGGVAQAGSGNQPGTGGSPPAGSRVVPRQPEMEAVMVDNATGTPLVQMLVGPPTLLLFEDGTIVSFYHDTDQDGNIVPPPILLKVSQLDGTTQFDTNIALHRDGSVRWWEHGATFFDAMTQLITGVDHAVFVSNGCALIADGSVRCWSPPQDGFSFVASPEGPAEPVEVAGLPALELEGNYNSRCTLVRNAQGAVTLFEAARPASGGVVATAERSLELDSPAIRLFEGCALERDGGARCVWAGSLDGSVHDADSRRLLGCLDAVAYDLVVPNNEQLLYASISADFHASALGVSGTVYFTIDRQEPVGDSIKLDKMPGVGPATFVRSGQYLTCAVVPPEIVCWSHEGNNRLEPLPLNLGTIY